MRLPELTFIDDKRLFIVITLLGLLGLLPALYPILYADGKPVTALGWPDNGQVKLYIDVFERFRTAYVPLYMASIALIIVGIIGSASPTLVAVDYVFILVVAYTLATIPLIRVASNDIPLQIKENTGGVLVITTFNSITYTPVYYMIRYYIPFIFGLFLSVAVGVYIVLTKD